MKKVLIVTSGINQGGITTLIKMWIENLKDKYNFELLVYDNSKDGFLNEELCKINYIDFNNISKLQFIKLLIELFKKNKYDVIHVNNLLNSGYVLLAAKIANIPVRICHSHASKNYKSSVVFRMYELMMKTLIKYCSNYKIGCSDKAAEYLFGNDNNVIVIPNAIDANKFSYNENERKKVREKYRVGNGEVLVGAVGMVYNVKNHDFIVELANYMFNKKHINNYKFIICGDGPLRKELEDKVKKYNLSDSVMFVGWDIDTAKYYSAYDIYVMPSISEGLPLSGLEAQAAGLPCVFSDNVSTQVKISNKCSFESVNNIDKWIEILIKYQNNDSRDNILINSKFDIKNQVSVLAGVYDK